MAKNFFNKHEKEIVMLLFSERRPMSIREISERTDMSWVTAKKWLKRLQTKGLVNKYGTKWKEKTKQ